MVRFPVRGLGAGPLHLHSFCGADPQESPFSKLEFRTPVRFFGAFVPNKKKKKKHNTLALAKYSSGSEERHREGYEVKGVILKTEEIMVDQTVRDIKCKQ